MTPSFLDVLEAIGDGEVAAKCGDALRRVVRAVDLTGNAGDLTLKLVVKPGGGSRKVLSVQLKVKIPTPNLPATEFYSTDGGDLQAGDPATSDRLRIEYQPPPTAA